MTTLEPYPELSVVFPAFNEARTIERVISETTEYLDNAGIRFEVNVVDDGSVDDTATVLRSISSRDSRVRVSTHRRNLGYGAALRTGLEAARGNRVLLSDSDGQFHIGQLEALWRRREEADIILGYRNPRKDPVMRRIAGWLYCRVLVRLLFGGRFRDVNCGFKLIDRSVLDGMEFLSRGALISAELLTRARMAGASTIEVGIEHRSRDTGKATGLLPRVVWRTCVEVIALRSQILECAAGRASAGLRAGYDPLESRSS